MPCDMGFDNGIGGGRSAICAGPIASAGEVFRVGQPIPPGRVQAGPSSVWDHPDLAPISPHRRDVPALTTRLSTTAPLRRYVS
jgi:hypothetical protein